MRRRVLAVLAVVAVGLLLGADDAGKKDKEKLQGTWDAKTHEQGGQSREENEGHKLIFSGDEFTIKKGDEAIIKGKVKLHPDKDPRQIDLEVTESKDGKHVGDTALGIYTLDGDTLKLCVSEPGEKERPKEFSTAQGDKRIMITLKKAK